MIHKLKLIWAEAMREEKEADAYERSMKVHRTLEGTIFEVALALILLAGWGAIALMHHSGSLSTANNGDPTSFILGCAFASAGGILFMGWAYFPHSYNTSPRAKNLRQMILKIRMLRCLSIYFGIIFICIIVEESCCHLFDHTVISWILWLSPYVLIPLFFEYLMYRARQAGSDNEDSSLEVRFFRLFDRII